MSEESLATAGSEPTADLKPLLAKIKLKTSEPEPTVVEQAPEPIEEVVEIEPAPELVPTEEKLDEASVSKELSPTQEKVLYLAAGLSLVIVFLILVLSLA